MVHVIIGQLVFPPRDRQARLTEQPVSGPLLDSLQKEKKKMAAHKLTLSVAQLRSGMAIYTHISLTKSTNNYIYNIYIWYMYCTYI